MPSLFDASTILLLLAPIALPRALQLAARIVAWVRRRKIAAAPSSVWQQPQQERSRTARYFQTCLLLVLALHAVLRLTLFRTFDIFNPLAGERIPLNVASSKLAAALQLNNLTQKHGHILPYLTSLDARLLYEHFGQDIFVTAHQVLGTATAKDLLVIHAARLIRLYAIVTLILALSRPRWRNYIGLLATAGCIAELYLLATTDISMRADGSCTSLLGTHLPFYRYLGLLATSATVWLLPARRSQQPLRQSEIATLAGLQQVIRNQDLLQTRIRALEALGSLDQSAQTEMKRAKQLSEVQAQELRKWLGAILDIPTAVTATNTTMEAGNGMSSMKQEEDVQVKMEPDDNLPQPKEQVVKEEEKLVKLEEAEGGLQQEPRALRPESILVPPILREDLLSPPMSSSSSSSSNGLETPTPATNRPQSFDLFAQKFDSAAARTEHRELEQQVNGIDLDNALPDAVMQIGTQSGRVNGEGGQADHSMVSGRAFDPNDSPPDAASSIPAPGFSIFERSVEEGSTMPSMQAPDGREQQAQADKTASSPNLPPVPIRSKTSEAEGINSTSEGYKGGTPDIDVIQDVDTNGWTTVVSKKHKPRS